VEESLRLAYLAAMDIPVWLLRGEEAVALDAESAPGGSAAPRARPPVHAAAGEAAPRLARELLDDRAGAPPAAPVPSAPSARATGRERAARERAGDRLPDFLLVSAGRFLFVDEAGTAVDDRRATELVAAIAFALGGERVAARPLRFDWSALGALGDRAQARDVLVGRLTKLLESATVDELVLMGAGPAAVLLDWDAERFAGRGARVQRIAGLEPGVLVTVSCAQMLEDPVQKRVAWEELLRARSPHGT